jgi:hypothetical protein
MAFIRRHRTDAPRREVIGGSVSHDERGEITAAFEQGGFTSMSDAIRAVALAYARSVKVRDGVAQWRKQDGAGGVREATR